MDKCKDDVCGGSKGRKPSSTSTFFPPNFCRSPGISTSCLNPGNISNLHKKTRDLTPEWIEGLSLRCAKNMDVHKAVYVEWLMGNVTPAGFRFGGILCQKDDECITKSPIIVGDTNPSTLATNLHFLYHPLPQIKIDSRIQTGTFPFASDRLNSMARIEYLRKDSTISLALHKPKRDSGRMTIGFLQNFNNNFCAGAQLLMGWNSQDRLHASIALAARYSFHKSSLATTLSKDALDVSFWHQPSDLLQLGASFAFNNRISKAVGSVCYQLEMKDAIVKGMIDSDWSVGCTYNRQLKNLASTFGFSVLFCIPTNKFYCGLKYELNSNFR